MRLRIKIAPLPVRSLVSSYKIPNRLIPRIFRLPIISCLWRTMYLDEDLHEEARVRGLNVRVLRGGTNAAREQPEIDFRNPDACDTRPFGIRDLQIQPVP